MSDVLLLATWLVPLLLAPAAVTRRGSWFAVAAVLPALTAAALVPVGSRVDLPWLLLGVHLQLDATGALFLAFSAVLWLIAALYAAMSPEGIARFVRFRVFFLLAMAGNLMLITAGDMLTFYVGFTLMGLSAYGLIVARRSQHARRAGRRYLVWSLLGEVALYAALVLMVAETGSLRFVEGTAQPLPTAAVALLVFGFGIKMALPGLHFWLPSTYTSAPPVAVAVLAGPMIKAGLLGWLRFLPPGTPGLSAWAEPLLAIGIAGVVFGAVAGLLQHNPRAVLGYSSILKMGVITAVFAIALAHPDAAPMLLASLSLYAMHHLLVKGALFLGVAEWERRGPSRLVLAGLGVLGLALAGAPFTGGAAAKTLLVDSAAGTLPGLPLLLTTSAFGSLLLVGRFLWLATRAEAVSVPVARGPSLVWLALVPAAVWLPLPAIELSAKPADVLSMLAALLLIVIAWSRYQGREQQRKRPLRRRLQWHSVLRSIAVLASRLPRGRRRLPAPALHRWFAAETGATTMARAGGYWLAVLVLLLILLMIG